MQSYRATLKRMTRTASKIISSFRHMQSGSVVARGNFARLQVVLFGVDFNISGYSFSGPEPLLSFLRLVIAEIQIKTLWICLAKTNANKIFSKSPEVSEPFKTKLKLFSWMNYQLHRGYQNKIGQKGYEAFLISISVPENIFFKWTKQNILVVVTHWDAIGKIFWIL